jgi:flagellar biogenesis protein FliO
MDQLNSLLIRYLQTNNTTATNSTTNVTATSVTKPALTMGQVAATTLKIYGVIFLILFLIYLFFRPIYKAAYNARGFHEVQ